MAEDRIYALPLAHVGDFRFDEQVVRVFPDMIRRSVPGYGSILAMTVELGRRFAQPTSHVYDLGCSLGAATLALRPHIPADCIIHAVDASAAMIDALKRAVPQDPALAEVRVEQALLQEVPIQSASLAILNFTLQFIDPADRETCLSRIYSGLLPGGALVLSEKVCFDDPKLQAQLTELHHAFKAANGYSDLEIAQKRSSLENTLITETVDTHLGRLQSVGFQQCCVWFQCLNFVSILAVK